MTRRALLAVIGACLVLVCGAAPGAAAVPQQHPAAGGDARPVVLVGTAGLSWTDVSRQATPVLWSLLRRGSTAALSVRSVFTNTCPVDGWLSLSAGTRAAAPPSSGSGRATSDPCPPAPRVRAGGTDGPGTRVPGWAGYVADADGRRFDAEPGLLGRVVADGGGCVSAVGPGGAVAGARPDGRVDRYAPWPAADRGGGLADALSACPVALVDVGELRDPADVAPGEDVPPAGRAAQVRALDARIGRAVAAAPAGADVLVASLADAGASERLRLVAATGPDYPAGELSSPSTRQPGLVQSADLTATVLARAGFEVPDGLGGAVLEGEEGRGAGDAAAASRLTHLVDLDEASHEVHPLVPVFFTGFVYAQLAIYLLVLLVWKGRLGPTGTRARLLGVVRAVGVVAASVPAATFLANLVPWWRSPHPLPTVVGVVSAFVAAISGVALLGPWRRSATAPVAVVSLATMLVLAGDVTTGSRLELSSLMGLQPVVGGRFYGLGNVAFSLFATSTLLLATVVADALLRRGRQGPAGLAVAGIGLVAVVVDGAPMWGADGGGPPALIPGVAYLTLAVLGIRLTWRRAVLIGAGTVVAFLGVAVLDHLRPPESQSHLGRFMGTLLGGGGADIVLRKAQQNLDILLSSTLTILVPFALAFVIYVLARPTSWGSRALQRSFETVTTLRAGLVAWVVTMTIGFFVNDSGVAIPAVGATVAIPLLVAMSVTALQEDGRARDEDAVPLRR